MTAAEEKEYQEGYEAGRSGKQLPDGADTTYAQGFVAGRLSLAWEKRGAL